MRQTQTNERYLYAGLIKLHVLHHAAKEPVYRLAMIEELGDTATSSARGRSIRFSTASKARGYLVSSRERAGSVARRVYRATRTGRKALTDAKVKVQDLFGELFEDD